MDPHAFDRFARACAAGGTRRRLVALLATLPVAGLLTTRARDAAAADRKLGGEPCNENRDCQTTICSGITPTVHLLQLPARCLRRPRRALLGAEAHSWNVHSPRTRRRRL